MVNHDPIRNQKWRLGVVRHVEEVTHNVSKTCRYYGSEFISRALDKWACENGVTIDFSRPGKTMDNAMIESFNGTFRDECLNVNWFLPMDDARGKIEKWRKDYNEFLPHSSLGDLTPRQFADKFGRSLQSQKTPLLAGPVWGAAPRVSRLFLPRVICE